MALTQVTQDRLRSWLHDLALEQILASDTLRNVLIQPHASIPARYAWEVESSRLGLLMNIFCCPDVWNSDGIDALIGCRCHHPAFFLTCPLLINDGRLDPTSIDIVFEDVFCQAVSPNERFVGQQVSVVNKYRCLEELFDVESLPSHNGIYENFRTIRNLLSAYQYGKRHVLLCDDRRSDLVEAYFATVAAIKNEELRSRCRIVFWQDLLHFVDADLSDFVSRRFLQR